MLLTIDLGNTNITLGVFDGAELLLTSRIATGRHKTEDQYAIELADILRLYGVHTGITDGIFASVVPSLDRVMRGAVEKATGIRPLQVLPGMKTGVNIRIDNPASLGADLLVGAVAAAAAYGAPVIIWDLGTATTVSVIDRDGLLRGGAILSGVRTSLQALIEGASLLPHIELEQPARVIGTDTAECMRIGAMCGAAAMLDGMSVRIADELGYPATTIATGGLAREIVPLCREKIIYDDHLLLRGLKILWEKNGR